MFVGGPYVGSFIDTFRAPNKKLSIVLKYSKRYSLTSEVIHVYLSMARVRVNIRPRIIKLRTFSRRYAYLIAKP